VATIINKLSASFVDKTSKAGRHSDGGGLYLQAKLRNGILRKSWLLLFKTHGRHTSQMLGLGGYPETSLAEARERARAAKAQIRGGVNPIDERKRLRAEAVDAAMAVRAEAVTQISFRQAAESYLGVNVHDRQWPQSLAAYAYPHIGDLPVKSITTAHVAAMLEPIWATMNTTARRLRGRVESVIGFAKAKGLCAGENPARWRDNLDAVFKSDKGVAKPEAHRALPYLELPPLMMKLRFRSSAAARALETLVLTGVRAGELLGMDWSEIDLASKVWTVPARRMKAGVEHRVPLASRVVEVLQGQGGPKPSGLVFPAGRGGGGVRMKADTLRALLHELLGTGETSSLHGMRSTFRTWVAERTGFADDVGEAALAHVVTDKVKSAYKRTDHLEQRARLMQMWADFCESTPTVDDEKVTPIRRTA
jgi:integrase